MSSEKLLTGSEINISKQSNEDKKCFSIVLAGNPNVGKSTLFNSLTGLNQHTGNWSGKTVSVSHGKCIKNGYSYIFADIPGCYSLRTQSADEVFASEYICTSEADCVVVVCDACCLERNLNLFLQICELSDKLVLALNFNDEARRKNINTNIAGLGSILGVPVVKIDARSNRGIDQLLEACRGCGYKKSFKLSYGKHIEKGIKIVEKHLEHTFPDSIKRFLAIRILEDDKNTWDFIKTHCDSGNMTHIYNARHIAMNYLYKKNINYEKLKDILAVSVVRTAEAIYKKTTKDFHEKPGLSIADKITTGKYTGFLLMIVLLTLVFYLTLKGANYPSAIIAKLLFSLEGSLLRICNGVHLPQKIGEMLIYGGYRVLSWVVSVMLPPMAIFFPLFTLLEDVGYLPRIAYNLDRCFKKCSACGKQALTTCMGFGCNAAGVTGARIIDSPREKLIAILTNSFIPCNGRFPAMLTIISLFMCNIPGMGELGSSMFLSLFIVFALIMSLVASYLLSHTFLKGIPSSFVLELPPYRMPLFGQVLIRSVLDRTLFVLGRACAVAFPAGILLYIMCNIKIVDISLINYISNFLNPLGHCMGLDGIIITAFIFAIPANEIVLPTIMLLYTRGSVLNPGFDTISVHNVLLSNGWTVRTAIFIIIFFIMHWPCSTTLMTIKKETGSYKWSIIAFLLPTVFGITLCMALNAIFNFCGILV